MISFVNDEGFAQPCNLPTSDPDNIIELEAANRLIADCFAPTIHQMAERGEENSANGRADLITAVNYDGNWNTADNWENLALFESGNTNTHNALDPVVYYSVVWTDDYWIITYAFYHPRDWSLDTGLCCEGANPIPGGDNHENDLEGAILVVRRTINEVFGAYTISHNDLLAFDDVSAVPDIFIDNRGHAVEANIGNDCIDDDGIANCDNCMKFDLGHIIYTRSANSLDGNSFVDANPITFQTSSGITILSANLVGNGEYLLDDIFSSDPNSLNSQRANSAVFQGNKFNSKVLDLNNHDCAGFGGDASAPWGWSQFEYTTDEIKFITCAALFDSHTCKIIDPEILFGEPVVIGHNPYFPEGCKYTIEGCCQESGPQLSVNDLFVDCPIEAVDIQFLLQEDIPYGNELVFSTDSDSSDGLSNRLNSTIIRRSGTFYAYYFNTARSCFSPGSPITIDIVGCCSESLIVVDDTRYSEPFENFGADVIIQNGGTLIIKEDHQITMNEGRSIVVSDGGTLIFEERSTLKECFQADSWDGIIVESGGTVIGDNATISGSSTYIIDAEAGSYTSLTSMHLRDSEFGIRFDGDANMDQYYLNTIENITFNGIEIVGDPGVLNNTFDFDTHPVSYNFITNTGWSGIEARNVKVLIKRFAISDCNLGVKLLDCPKSQIANSIIDFNKTAISLNRCAESYIDNNSLGYYAFQSNQPNDYGIFANRSVDINITNNVIYSKKNCIQSQSSALNVDANTMSLEPSPGWVNSVVQSVVSNDIYSNNYIDVKDGLQGFDMVFSDQSQITNNDIECLVPGKMGINLRTGMQYNLGQNRIITASNGTRARQAVNVENSGNNTIYCNDLEGQEEALFVRDNSMVQDLDANIFTGQTALRFRSLLEPQSDKGNEFYKLDGSKGGILTAEGLSFEQIQESSFLVNPTIEEQVPVAEPDFVGLVNASSSITPEGCDQSLIGPNWDGVIDPPAIVVCDIVDGLNAIQESDESRYTINMIHLYRYFLMRLPIAEWPECLSIKWINDELCGIKELVTAQKNFNESIYNYYQSDLHDYIAQSEEGDEQTISQLNSQYQLSVDNGMTEAEADLMNIICDDEIVTTWKEIMILLIKYIRQETMNGGDMYTLQQTAQLCSSDYGDPVNWADMMYSNITESSLAPATNCGQEAALYFQLPDNAVKVSPNPSTGLFIIDVPMDYSKLSYTISDNIGRIIASGSSKKVETLNLDIQQESTGIYFLHLVIDNDKEISKKLVLVK